MMTNVLIGALPGCVLLGMVRTLTIFAQFLAVGLHGVRNHYPKCRDITPRVAFLLPAWNEGAVVGTSIDWLVRLDYPAGRLRIYVVDDASTDDTPDVTRATDRYPGRVFHLRREKGGQGKAHTFNHGIKTSSRRTGAEALLIMDADVIYRPDSLRKMTRHLADPEVGAVTAFIWEGSADPRYMTRFIGYEYVASQAAARRAQNVLGGLACLAGGAQLHDGKIWWPSAAGSTPPPWPRTPYTTITQLNGRRVVFEPYAVVLAEEPEGIGALWKQRVRWGRGNLQITGAFRRLWFRSDRSRSSATSPSASCGSASPSCRCS